MGITSGFRPRALTRSFRPDSRTFVSSIAALSLPLTHSFAQAESSSGSRRKGRKAGRRVGGLGRVVPLPPPSELPCLSSSSHQPHDSTSHLLLLLLLLLLCRVPTPQTRQRTAAPHSAGKGQSWRAERERRGGGGGGALRRPQRGGLAGEVSTFQVSTPLTARRAPPRNEWCVTRCGSGFPPELRLTLPKRLRRAYLEIGICLNRGSEKEEIGRSAEIKARDTLIDRERER